MSIAKIDPKQTIKIVSVLDDAIDTEKSNMENYEENYDLKDLKFLEGQFPTYFIIKNILSTSQVIIQQDHLKVELPDIKPGQRLSKDDVKKVKVKQVDQGQMLIKYFKEGCQKYEEEGKQFDCDPDLFSSQIIQEIGSFIMLRSSLGDKRKKN